MVEATLLQNRLNSPSWVDTLRVLTTDNETHLKLYKRPNTELPDRLAAAEILDGARQPHTGYNFLHTVASAALAKDVRIFQPYPGRTERHVINGYRERIAEYVIASLKEDDAQILLAADSYNFVPKTFLALRAAVTLEYLQPSSHHEIGSHAWYALDDFIRVYSSPPSQKLNNLEQFEKARDTAVKQYGLIDLYNLLYAQGAVNTKRPNTISSFLPFEAEHIFIPFLDSAYLNNDEIGLSTFDVEVLMATVLGAPREIICHNIRQATGVALSVEAMTGYASTLITGIPYSSLVNSYR